MPRMAIDTSPVQAQFLNGNPLSDGMANFATALIQAPIAADQIRRQQADKDVAQAWQRKEFDQRKTQADQAQSNWLDNFKAQMAQRQIENTRQDESQQLSRARDFGIAPPMALAPTDLNRALWSAADVGKKDRARADRKNSLEELAMLFKAGGVGANGRRDYSTGWHQADDKTWFSRRPDGTTEVFDPATKMRTVFDPKGNPVDAPAPVKVGQMVGGMPAQGTGEDGKVMFPTPDAGPNWYDFMRPTERVAQAPGFLDTLFAGYANAGGARDNARRSPPVAIPQAQPAQPNDPNDLAASSFQKVAAAAQSAKITPQQRTKFLATQQDLHQRLAQAMASGDQATAERVNAAIIKHQSLLGN